MTLPNERMGKVMVGFCRRMILLCTSLADSSILRSIATLAISGGLLFFLLCAEYIVIKRLSDGLAGLEDEDLVGSPIAIDYSL